MASKKGAPRKRLRLVKGSEDNMSNDSGDSGDRCGQRKRVYYEKGFPKRCLAESMEHLDNVDGLYENAGRLVKIISQNRGRDTIYPISEAELTCCVSGSICYYNKITTRVGVQDNILAPPKLVMTALHRVGHWPKVPYLRAITSHPVIWHDGSIRREPGYDPKTQVFSTHKGDLDVKPLSQDEAKHARSMLLELVDEFPFVGVSADVWLGSLLTPLVRPWCGPSPLFIMTSSTPSAGKGRLVDILSIISCGGEGIEGGALPPNKEEWQKCLISWALACPEIIYFDNVFSGSRIGSDVLDMALTRDKFSGRILGQSKSIEVELLATWIMSGNNLSTRGDTSRRSLICRIEPRVEHPEMRTFRIPDILKHTQKHRAHYLSCACGILAGWLASRSPSPTPILGSFERWSHVVRGAIMWAGGADIIEALATQVSDSDDLAAIHRSLLEEWHKTLKEPISAAKLLDLCENASDLYHGKLSDIISELCPGKGPAKFGSVKSLSVNFRGLENRVRNIQKDNNSVRMAVKRVPQTAPILWYVEILD